MTGMRAEFDRAETAARLAFADFAAGTQPDHRPLPVVPFAWKRGAAALAFALFAIWLFF